MLGKAMRARLIVAPFVVGLGLWLFGALDDGHLDDADLRGLGIMLIVMTGIGVVAARAVVSERLIERMRQEGYDSGYVDGCEVNRPRVVSMIGAGSDRSSTALFRAAQELGQERDVGRRSDRVF